MQFKEGDIVKVRRECSGCVPEETYILTHGSKIYRMAGLWAYRRYDNGTITACHCENNWILVKQKNMTKEEMLKSIKELSTVF